MREAPGNFRYDVLDGVTEDGNVEDRHGIHPVGIEDICNRYAGRKSDAPTRRISMAVIPELKYFSATRLLEAQPRRSLAPRAKRQLAISREMPKNSHQYLAAAAGIGDEAAKRRGPDGKENQPGTDLADVLFSQARQL